MAAIPPGDGRAAAAAPRARWELGARGARGSVAAVFPARIAHPARTLASPQRDVGHRVVFPIVRKRVDIRVSRVVHRPAMDARILPRGRDPSIREVTAMGLRAAGFEVDTAADGAAGLEKWRRAEPDLVLLDVMLPAWTASRSVARDSARIDQPVVMLTARGDTIASCRSRSGRRRLRQKPCGCRSSRARPRRPPPHERQRHQRPRAGPVRPLSSSMSPGDR